MSSCKDLHCPAPRCYPDICSDPYVDAWNEPCFTSCEDSRAVIYPSPVVVRLPGPILIICPQDSIVGSTLPDVPNGYGGSYGSGSFGGSVNFGSGYAGGYSSVYGSLYGYGRRFGRKCYSSCFGSYGPC